MLDLIKIRKDLHKIPEIGFQEFKTQEFILSILKNWEEITIHTLKNHTGIIVEYSFGADDYLLFRADMDALPMFEKTNVDFASTHENFMHACGHDIHMTILLGLIEKVIKEKVKKNILFVFQPAEEGLGGAVKILEHKIFSQKKISECYATHVSGILPTNTVSTKPGIFFGIPQEFDVIFTGKGSHVAFPHEGKDSLIAANHFYQIMNSHITLQFPPTEPVIFRVGEMNSGTVRNILPQTTILKGTTRTLSKKNWKKVNDLIEKTALHVAQIFDLEVEVILSSTYDPVVNSEILYKKLKNKIPEEINFVEAETVMTGEDFGFFTSKYDGLLFWLGAETNGENLHSSSFLPDENAIQIGVDVFWSIIS